MCNTDYNKDEQFRQMLEQFLYRLITVHGLSSEEKHFSEDELQRAYDQQKTLRRSKFTLIHGDLPD